MRILCLSDQIDPLVYSTTMRDRFASVDLVLSAGDLPMDYLEFVVSSLNKPLLFIFGNHNLEEYDHYCAPHETQLQSPQAWLDSKLGNSGAIHLGSKVLKESGLLLAGIDGSLRYNNGKNQYSPRQMHLKLLKLIPRLVWNRLVHGRYLDILLTHAPPQGIHDREDLCHRGVSAFLWFMKTFRPRYLIHGHIHLYDLNETRVSRYENTVVVNAFSHYLIDTEESP